jgi:hypothetical protein
VKFYILNLCMVLKIGHNGKCIRNTWKVLKCRAGEGWKKSVGPVVTNEVLLRVKERHDLTNIERRKSNWICHICIGTVL